MHWSLPVVFVVAVFLTPMARADSYKGTLCADFNPDACGCHGKCALVPFPFFFTEAQDFDHPVPIFTADSVARPLNRLLVYFHGHGGQPDGNLDFLKFAAKQGYDAVSLDYDYGRDYENQPNMMPPDSHCEHPFTDKDKKEVCGMSIDRVCGCFSECYDHRDTQTLFGGSHCGLATTMPDWTVEARLASTILWMLKHAHTEAEKKRFVAYATGPFINWSAIAVAGHSLGTSMAGYLGSKESVERVILFSGLCEKLFPDWDAGKNKWGTCFGCKTPGGTDENGNRYPFTNATCEPTTYGYTNSEGGCSTRMTPPEWMCNITHPNKYFFLQDSDDDTCNWVAGDKPGQDKIDDSSVHIDKQHVAGAAAGWNKVGDYQNWNGLQSGGWHGVVSEGSNGKASQICSHGNGHTAVISDTACTDAEQTTHREDVWKFMLTSPTN